MAQPPAKRARTATDLPPDLVSAIENIYNKCGVEVAEVRREEEGREYGACRLRIGGRNAVFRVAKTTPTKVGQFVMTWKRSGQTIGPFDEEDDIDLLIISAGDARGARGQFIFSKKVLVSKGIVSTASKRGKNGTRVYPPSAQTVVKAAVDAQAWQLQFFLPIAADGSADASQARKLLLK